MTESKVQFDATVCLKSQSDFGVEHVHNICQGTVIDVPWGSSDWVLCIFLLALGVVGIAMLIGFAKSIWFD